MIETACGYLGDRETDRRVRRTSEHFRESGTFQDLNPCGDAVVHGTANATWSLVHGVASALNAGGLVPYLKTCSMVILASSQVRSIAAMIFGTSVSLVSSSARRLLMNCEIKSSTQAPYDSKGKRVRA